MAAILEEEFDYYIENQDEIVKLYNGRVVVVKGMKIIGDYDSEAEAVSETAKAYEIGTFLVQRCSPGSTDYTAVFNSRVRFLEAYA